VRAVAVAFSQRDKTDRAGARTDSYSRGMAMLSQWSVLSTSGSGSMRLHELCEISRGLTRRQHQQGDRCARLADAGDEMRICFFRSSVAGEYRVSAVADLVLGETGRLGGVWFLLWRWLPIDY